MPVLNFLVEITVEREGGKFVSRDEISSIVAVELSESADNAALTGLGMDGNSDYYAENTTVTELDKKDLKALWKTSEQRVIDNLPTDAAMRKRIKEQNNELRLKVEEIRRLKDALEVKYTEQEKGATNIWFNPGSALEHRNRVYLPDGRFNRILFGIGDPDLSESFAVERQDGGALEIRMDGMGRYEMIVRPVSSNVVVVEALER